MRRETLNLLSSATQPANNFPINRDERKLQIAIIQRIRFGISELKRNSGKLNLHNDSHGNGAALMMDY